MMDAHFIKDFQEAHITAWNEKDRTKRDNLISTIYAADIRMHDPSFTLTGIKEISDFIDKVQSDSMFDFTVEKPIESVQSAARLFWTIKTSEGNFTGMDFFEFKDSKVISLYVFMDQQQ